MTTTYTPDNQMSERIDNSFRYHAPFGNQAGRYEGIRAFGLAFAYHIIHACPPSRELTLAITAIEEAVMRANQAIALNEKPPVEEEMI